jgi:hypothetical protein
MHTQSGSEADTDRGSEASTAQAGAAGTVQGEGGDRAVAGVGGFRLPLPGGLAGGLAGGMDPKRLWWWGGLAALAAIEIIEWPVALAVGVGSYVAERLAREEVREEIRKDLGQRS